VRSHGKGVRNDRKRVRSHGKGVRNDRKVFNTF